MILDDHLGLAMLLGFGLAWLFQVLLLWQVRQQAGSLYALMLGLSRVVVTVLLALLLWQIFVMVSFEKMQRPDPFREPHRLALLVDDSGSMSLPGSKGRDRRHWAAEVVEKMTVARQDVPEEDLEVRSYYFADRLVESSERQRLDLSRSSLDAALQQLLANWNPEAVVVCSDGAANEVPISEGTLNLLKRRGLRVMCIVPGDGASKLFDLTADELGMPRFDPEHLKLTASLRPMVPVQGVIQSDVQFMMKIDGRQSQLEVRPLSGSQAFTFEMPDVLPGWHEISMEMLRQDSEIYGENNRLRSAFFVSPRRRLLYIYGEDNLEGREQIQLMRSLYPSEIDYLDVRDPSAIEKLNLDEIEVLWIQNVLPEQVPEPLMAKLHDGSADLVLWGGDGLEAWSNENIPDFPLAALEAHQLDESEGEWPVMLLGPDARLLKNFKGMPLHTRLIPRWTLMEGSWSELVGRYGEMEFPVLAMAQREQRLVAVSVLNGAWRWMRRRDEQDREFYGDLHERLLKRLIFPDPLPELSMEVQVVGSSPLSLEMKGQSLSSLGIGQMDQVRFELRAGEETEVHLAEYKEEGFTATVPIEWDRVYFGRALAFAEGRELFSDFQPIWRREVKPEFMETALRPDRLRPLAGAEGQVIWASEIGDSLQRLVEGYRPESRNLELRKRASGRELVLAILLILALLADWKLEKWVRERKTGK